MIVKLLTEHHLEFLSLTGGCRGSSESTLVKMLHCWKSHVTAHYLGRLPNSIFTDDIVGVGADNDSPYIVKKMMSNQVLWHKTCRNSIDTKKYREPGREEDQRWLLVQ